MTNCKRLVQIRGGAWSRPSPLRYFDPPPRTSTSCHVSYCGQSSINFANYRKNIITFLFGASRLFSNKISYYFLVFNSEMQDNYKDHNNQSSFCSSVVHIFLILHIYWYKLFRIAPLQPMNMVKHIIQYNQFIIKSKTKFTYIYINMVKHITQYNQFIVKSKIKICIYIYGQTYYTYMINLLLNQKSKFTYIYIYMVWFLETKDKSQSSSRNHTYCSTA